jgi:hypothetical protein
MPGQKLPELGGSSLHFSGLGAGLALWATAKYNVTLLKTKGQMVNLVAHGLENIASNLDAITPGSYGRPSLRFQKRGWKEGLERSVF